MKPLLNLINLTLIVLSPISYVLSEDLESDRPDFTEGTLAQPPGTFQLEAGYTYTKYSGNSEDHTLPEFLLRAGLVEGTELRIAWDGIIWSSFDDQDENGASDMSLGAKTRILNEIDGFNLSVIYELGLPVGSHEYSANEVEPGVKFLLAQDLSEKLGLSGNVNLSSLEGEEERYLELGLSASLGFDIDDKFGNYLEFYSLIPTESVVETDEHYINSGLTYLVNQDLQFDARVGFGINSAAADLFTGAGVVIRFN